MIKDYDDGSREGKTNTGKMRKEEEERTRRTEQRRAFISLDGESSIRWNGAGREL